jgi:hypothetical protein
VAHTIRIVAIVASVVVGLGFLMFAADETRRGSEAQQAKLDRELGNDPAPTPSQEAERERRHGPVREAVDDANDYLLAPFTGLVSSRNSWVARGVPALLALLVYGLGLTMLANSLPKPRAHGGDWRAA